MYNAGMDYGDRQGRAEMLVAHLRGRGDRLLPGVVDGRTWTANEVVHEIEHEIEQMTERGRALVAVTGLVLHAIQADPDFFRRGPQVG